MRSIVAASILVFSILAGDAANACEPTNFRVYFPADDAALPAYAEEDLHHLLTIASHPDAQGVWIKGHTDTVGSGEANHELARRRAQAVADWLAKNGLPADKLVEVNESGEEEGQVPIPDETREPLNNYVELNQFGRQIDGNCHWISSDPKAE